MSLKNIIYKKIKLQNINDSIQTANSIYKDKICGLALFSDNAKENHETIILGLTLLIDYLNSEFMVDFVKKIIYINSVDEECNHNNKSIDFSTLSIALEIANKNKDTINNKKKLCYWNEMLSVYNSNGSIIAYDNVYNMFYFDSEGNYIEDTPRVSKNLLHMQKGVTGIFLSYNDSINLFYNYCRSYEIYMDYFVISDEERNLLNPEYNKFKDILPKLEDLYFTLVEKGDIIQIEQPELYLGFDNNERVVR